MISSLKKYVLNDPAQPPADSSPPGAQAHQRANVSSRSSNPVGDLAKAIRKNPELPPDAPEARAFRVRVGWDCLTGKVQESQWVSVYRQAKALGLDKAAAQKSLTKCLPLAPEIAAQRTAKAATKKALAELPSMLANLSTLQTIIESEKEALTKERSEIDKLRTQVSSREKIVEEEKLTLQSLRIGIETEQSELDAKWSALEADQAILCDLQKPIPPHVMVEVDKTTFALDANAVIKAGGYLKVAFFSEFKPKAGRELNADGAWVLSYPRLTRDEFRMVARFLDGELPEQMTPEMTAMATYAARALCVEPMLKAIADRAPKPQKWELKQVMAQHAEPYLEKGWEPFATTVKKGTCIDTLHVALRRQVPIEGENKSI